MCSQSPKINHTLEELKQWKLLSLKEFCKIHQVSSSNKTKDELAALAYSIQVVGLKPSMSETQAIIQSKSEYQNLLRIGK